MRVLSTAPGAARLCSCGHGLHARVSLCTVLINFFYTGSSCLERLPSMSVIKTHSREPRNLFIKKKIALGQDGWQLCLQLAGARLPAQHPSLLTKDQHRHDGRAQSTGKRLYLVRPHPPCPFRCHQSLSPALFLLPTDLQYVALLVVLLASGLFTGAFSLLLCLGRTCKWLLFLQSVNVK